MRFVRERAPAFLERMADRQPNGSVAHRFWQRARGYDRNIWSPRYVWEPIDDIHTHPVGRNLCERPEDWGWSSAADYVGVRAGPFAVDFASHPKAPTNDYVEFWVA